MESRYSAAGERPGVRGLPRVVPLAGTTHALALEIAREPDYAILNILILATAIEAGCDELANADVRDGREIRATTIRHPSADQVR